ncbi:50S ribosomal protein L18, partial [Pelagibacteraceae bacterium]|nr:50S ribosomal protein L18 [Pelagibacteraceae bacterium]
DTKGITLASSSSLEKTIKDPSLSRKEIAEKIGKNIAKKIISKGIKEVAFDRGKYKYHGLIKILADAARVEGLNF